MANLVKPAPYPTASMRRSAPKPYVPTPPKPFIQMPSRHDRAIVCPWLSVDAPWDELRWSLRSVDRCFVDKECPIYVIGDRPPKWLKEGERVQYIHIPEYKQSRQAGLWAAWQIGMQIAEEVCWTNDDIYFLKKTGWDDMRVALTEGTLDEQEDVLRASDNVWRVSLGEACAELRRRGHSPVWRFATHTPYLFERGKSLEIFREYHIAYKGSWVTLYHNHHQTPHEDCTPHKTSSLPAQGSPRFLNHRHNGPDAKTQDELRRMFPNPAPWEK